ncbi:MAG TPA: hypothetical protein VN203_15050, partial [Candidatus Acidoferrum sp.]|nr:hypothetical protein [Candidatus Acidoferrum sp.]
PRGKVRRGPVSYIAQTGNFATHTMRWINTAERFGVARVAGLGNKIDIEDSEVLDYLGRDPETKAVLMYVEGFRRPRSFLEVAKRVTRKKPVIILKGGRTKAGAERAFSHTASLAGNEALFDGAFRQAGIARLRRYVDLVNVAKGIAFQPIPKGRRVSAMAPSGALGVVVADTCESMGLKMASHSESTVKKLREVTASWVNISNPVDMSAVVSQLGQVEGNRTVAETLLRDEGSEALVSVLLASPRIPAEAYGYLPELARRFPQKPIYVSFTGDQEAYARAREYLEERSIPVFYPLEDIFEVLHVLCDCREQLDRAD